jgi:hypothetical protein
MMMPMPLRYEISDWTQATQCISNNSLKLHIRVSKINNLPSLSGTRIAVEHDLYGILFSTVIDANGDVITSLEDQDLTTDDILLQLSKYGFLIEYAVNDQMTSEQISYLITLDGLKFDKIRSLPVIEYNYFGIQEAKTYIVVFQSDKLPKWLDANFAVSKKEFLRALEKGSALNLNGISETKGFNWDWLTFIGTIKEIIQDYDYAQEEESGD